MQVLVLGVVDHGAVQLVRVLVVVVMQINCSEWAKQIQNASFIGQLSYGIHHLSEITTSLSPSLLPGSTSNFAVNLRSTHSLPSQPQKSCFPSAFLFSMSHKTLDSRNSIDSCTFQLHSWRPFHLQSPEPPDPPKPYYYSSSSNAFHSHHALAKRPCLSDRATSFPIDSIDMSKLSLVDDDKPIRCKQGSLHLVARKRRRRGSRSVSGRSSDRSVTRRCCSVGASAAYGTCSDLAVAMGTDSSGELFGNGDANWSSDVSEAKNSLRDREEKENSGVGIGLGQFGNLDAQGIESGYGSEPGYRGDAEFGYGDEVDEEEEDTRLLFWGHQFGGKFLFLSYSFSLRLCHS